MSALKYPQAIAQKSMLLLALSIPISVVLGNLMLAIVLCCGLLFYAKKVWHIAVEHPAARAALLLFLSLALGCALGDAPLGEALVMLSKYMDLAFIPLFLLLFKDQTLRQRAELVLIATLLLTAVLSWLIGLRVLGVDFCVWESCEASNPSVFLSHIPHNMMMAFATFLFALKAREEKIVKLKLAYIGLALFTGADVLFLVQGRTGYMVMGALVAYFIWVALQQYLHKRARRLGWKEGVIFLTLLGLSVGGAYQLSSRLQQRVDLIVAESFAWKNTGKNDSSTGQRLEFYSNSLEIIKAHPLVGVGTGGFAEAYRQQVEPKGLVPTRNPHNEYLHLTAQLGIAGCVLFLFLLYTQWRTAAQLKNAYDRDAAIGLTLTLMVASLFNTPLMDHTEGLFFAYAGALYFSAYCSPSPNA